jgi:hypothetical protein
MNALRDLPLISDQTAFNVDRWDELCADSLWLDVEGKIETDRYGQVIVNPPTEYSHGGKQADLVGLLARHAPPGGKVAVESAISTSEGVKVADVTWVSAKRFNRKRRGDGRLSRPGRSASVPESRTPAGSRPRDNATRL